jgi:hypothetical protein
MDVEFCTPGLNANDDRRSFMEKHTEFSVRSETGSGPSQLIRQPISADKCDWSAAGANSAAAVNRPVAAAKCDWSSDSNVLSRSAASAVNRPVAADKCDWNSDSNVFSRSTAGTTIQRPVIGADKCDWVAVGVNRPGLSAAIYRPVIGADKCDWVAQSYVPFRATPERITPVQPGA